MALIAKTTYSTQPCGCMWAGNCANRRGSTRTIRFCTRATRTSGTPPFRRVCKQVRARARRVQSAMAPCCCQHLLTHSLTHALTH
eukprot:1193981-Prorocentrum_minimum.AAC.2